MAEITVNKNSKGPRRLLKHIRVDLTPMVDLGFLLISFFIFTTQLTKPVGMKLNMPADSPDTTHVKKSLSLTLMPTAENKVWVYEGLASENQRANLYSTNDLTAFRKMLISKRESVKQLSGDGSNLVALIKPDKSCSYQTLVDILDEMTINAISHYAIEDRDGDDEKLVPIP